MRHRSSTAFWSQLSAALLALGVAALAPSAAFADEAQDYLALGDSVAFGENPLLDPNNAKNFIGYPSPVARELELRLTNPSCPGETSGHFISLAGVDFKCGGYRQNFPLHVAYTASQLDFADAFLQSHWDTRLVSLDLGANDLFLLQQQCNNDPICIEQGLGGPNGLLATLSRNLDTIYGHIRNFDGYRRQIVALTYYALNYSDASTTGLIAQINHVVAARTRAWGGIVANGFEAFADASALFNGDTCAAGLRIQLTPPPNQTCDIHPTPLGRRILARTILEAAPEGDGVALVGGAPQRAF